MFKEGKNALLVLEVVLSLNTLLFFQLLSEKVCLLTEQAEQQTGSKHHPLVPGDPVHVEAEQGPTGDDIHRDPGQ